MSFQWLSMRISEEQDRRRREEWIRGRMPAALADLHDSLKLCVDAYKEAFGAQSAAIDRGEAHIGVTVLEQREGAWQARAEVRIEPVAALPGFRIASGGEAVDLEVGMLPGDRVFYRQGDDFLTMEQVTKLILDRSLFPKLRE
jgi:hypothetical protein